MGIWDEPGCFCEVYGITLENRILEHILICQGTDWAVGDMAKELKISRPKTYEVINQLEKKGIVKKSRIIGRTQLYTLNTENSLSKIYMRNFNECLQMVVDEHTKPAISIKRMQMAATKRM